jgi:hypothetical protein
MLNNYDNLEEETSKQFASNLLNSSQDIYCWAHGENMRARIQFHPKDNEPICSGCGAVNNQFHALGCELETCTICNNHISSCACLLDGQARPTHKTVLLQGLIDAVAIDYIIAPLINHLWSAGIRTFNCCQENPKEGWMWIEFASTDDAIKFLNIVAKYEEGYEALYNRMNHRWNYIDREIIGIWQYDIMTVDDSIVEEYYEDDSVEESCTGPADFSFSVSVRFPSTDFPVILNRLMEYNQANRNMKH